MLKTLTYPGAIDVTVDVRNPEDHIQKYWMNGNYYEAQRNGLLNHFASFHAPGLVWVDCGAHIGNHTLFMLARMRAARVWAFEPVPESFEHLLENLSLNRLPLQPERLVCRQYALSNKSGHAKMSAMSENNSGMWRIVESKGDIRVEIGRLDDYLDEEEVDIIKMDVEHHQIPALEGAVETIRKHKPFLYIEAEAEDQFRDLQRFMLTLGYLHFGQWNHTATYGFRHQDGL